MAKNEVKIKIIADDETKKGVDSATKSFGKMAKTIGPLVAAGFGIAAVKAVTSAYIRQEDAIAQLDARLKSTGNTVGFTSKQLQNMASSLQGVTKFGDEAIIEMQSLLLTFTKIGGQTFPQATEAILNVSTAMGQDLQTAAIQVGKALNDPVAGISAMSRSGIQFSEDQKQLIKDLVEMGDTAGAQTVILKELEVQFGGAARAAKDTLGGSLQSAENDIGDLAESIGGILSPTIAELADVASFAARALREMIDPTLQGDLAEINSEIENMGSLLNDMIAEGTAQNQIDFVENQIDDLITKRLELEQKIVEINSPIAQAGGATQTGGVPGSAADQASGLPPSIADFRQFDAERLAEVNAAILSQEIAQGQLLTDTWLKVAREKDAVDQRSFDAKQMLVNEELAIEQTKNKALGELASLMNSKNKEAFAIGKAAAIAQATISTYESAVSSYKAMSGIPYVGPALGVAAAAAAIAAGLSNVQAIASTQFGGKGGGQPATPNITTGGQVVGPVIQPPGQFDTQTQGAPIIVEGNSLLAVMVEEQLMPAINDAITRGVTLVIK